MLIFLIAQSCNDYFIDSQSKQFLQDIEQDKYYSEDPLQNLSIDLYGSWKLVNSNGGFSGQGYELDFDVLVTKPNGIFGIIRSDSLIAYGKIVTKLHENDRITYFEADNTSITRDIVLLYSPVDTFIFKDDKLHFIAPCCDGFNSVFEPL